MLPIFARRGIQGYVYAFSLYEDMGLLQSSFQLGLELALDYL